MPSSRYIDYYQHQQKTVSVYEPSTLPYFYSSGSILHYAARDPEFQAIYWPCNCRWVYTIHAVTRFYIVHIRCLLLLRNSNSKAPGNWLLNKTKMPCLQIACCQKIPKKKKKKRKKINAYYYCLYHNMDG